MFKWIEKLVDKVVGSYQVDEPPKYLSGSLEKKN